MRRIVTITILLLCSAKLVAQNVEQYFQLLPDSVFSDCDWRDTSKNSMSKSGIQIVDIPNGFLAFKRHKDEEDFFQMALFKGSNKEDYIFVRNQACEHCCCEEPKSYLYLVKAGNWKEVSSTKLPKLELDLFLSDPELLATLKKVDGYYLYKFHLPQVGVEVGIELRICDYIVEDGKVDGDTYNDLILSSPNRKMVWDKKRNVFELILKK